MRITTDACADGGAQSVPPLAGCGGMVADHVAAVCGQPRSAAGAVTRLSP